MGEPVAYVIGHQPFLGLTIHLDSRPLIPRPETEWWVSEMLEQYNERGCTKFEGVPQGDDPRPSNFAAEKYATLKFGTPSRCLDLCAGSGAIGCAMLAAFPTARVFFGEIDRTHETTIRKNIEVNLPRVVGKAGGLDASRAYISIGDLFAPFADQHFDLIACNPPYVPEERKLPASVASFEPALALRAGADGLDLIRRIAKELPAHLTQNGSAWVECDSAHAASACALFTGFGMQAKIRTDHYGTPRIIVVSFS